MNEQSIDTERILAELSHGILNANQVSDILNNPKEFPTLLIKKLSIETALKYWKEQLSYDAADCIMNNIYSFWVWNDYFFTTYPFTDEAWECFEAFDAGEYHRLNDDKDIDSEMKYTRPLVEELLRRRMLV